LSFILCTALLASIFFVAIRIRLFAVITYGRIIHEFDPWFNYRATEYMVEHGYAKFEAWYDDKVWYPLGRHVGSTTYPGLQLTAYALHELLKHVHPMSVNDVCVLMPAAFGGIASLLCGALAYEVTFSRAAAISAAALMAVLPAPVIQADAEIQTPDPSRSRNPHP
jgi:dolichyl-diphosphooligosaccharide--protein glycosyltransferase